MDQLINKEENQCEICGEKADVLFAVSYIDAGTVLNICADCKDIEELNRGEDEDGPE